MKHRLLIAFLIVTSSVSFSYAQQYGWVNIGYHQAYITIECKPDHFQKQKK